MKKYEAPKLHVDQFVADTMIASGGSFKNGNPDNNQNCAGCRNSYGAADPQNSENWCNILPGTQAYDAWC